MHVNSRRGHPEISYDAENEIVSVLLVSRNPKSYPLAKYLHVLDVPSVRQLLGDGVYTQDAVYFFGRSTYQGRELARQVPNFNFATGDGHVWIDLNGAMIYINDTQAPKLLKESKNDNLRLNLGKKDLQVLFVLLVDDKLLGASQSVIAEAASVSQATSSRTIRKLEAFLKAKIGSPSWLEMYEYLIDYWSERYIEKLRPKLTALKYRPTWSLDKVPKPPLAYQLSGAAAMIYEKEYLANAHTIELYGDPKERTRLRSYGLLPDFEGPVIVRECFWNLEFKTTVPDILIFADLLATGNPRDREAAQVIRKRHLAEKKMK